MMRHTLHDELLPGMKAFALQFKPKRQLLVGGQGIPLEEFLSKPAAHWLDWNIKGGAWRKKRRCGPPSPDSANRSLTHGSAIVVRSRSHQAKPSLPNERGKAMDLAWSL